MNKIEFILAIISNVRTLFFIASVLVGIGTVILGIMCFIDIVDGSGDFAKKAIPFYAAKILPFFVLILIFCALPSIDDIWKVRIGLIKLELASPENIKKGSEEIIRIGKKLECKYVGCDEGSGNGKDKKD